MTYSFVGHVMFNESLQSTFNMFNDQVVTLSLAKVTKASSTFCSFFALVSM